MSAAYCEDFDTPDGGWAQAAIGDGNMEVEPRGASPPFGLRATVSGEEVERYAALALSLSPARPQVLRLELDFLMDELPPEEGGVLLVQVRTYPTPGESADPDNTQNVQLFLNRGSFYLDEVVPPPGAAGSGSGRTLVRSWSPGAWSHLEMVIEFAPAATVEVRVDGQAALVKSDLAPYVRTGALNATLGVVWVKPSGSASVWLDNVRAVID